MSDEFDSFDEEQDIERQNKISIERERQLEEIKQVMSTAGGRYLMWRILGWCGVYHSTSSTDTTLMAILSGKRDIGLELILELMRTDVKLYNLMNIEGKERDDGINE